MANGLSNDDKTELLRYFIGSNGNPPYLQDQRFRELVSVFVSNDDAPVTGDTRLSPGAADDQGIADGGAALSAGEADYAASQVGGANDTATDDDTKPEAAKTPAQQNDEK